MGGEIGPRQYTTTSVKVHKCGPRQQHVSWKQLSRCYWSRQHFDVQGSISRRVIGLVIDQCTALYMFLVITLWVSNSTAPSSSDNDSMNLVKTVDGSLGHDAPLFKATRRVIPEEYQRVDKRRLLFSVISPQRIWSFCFPFMVVLIPNHIAVLTMGRPYCHHCVFYPLTSLCYSWKLIFIAFLSFFHQFLDLFCKITIFHVLLSISLYHLHSFSEWKLEIMLIL